MNEHKHLTKHALVIDLISKPDGVTIEDIMIATGWQHNSTRGMLTGLRTAPRFKYGPAARTRAVVRSVAGRSIIC